jgi:hypothetical protein
MVSRDSCGRIDHLYLFPVNESVSVGIAVGAILACVSDSTANSARFGPSVRYGFTSAYFLSNARSNEGEIALSVYDANERAWSYLDFQDLKG